MKLNGVKYSRAQWSGVDAKKYRGQTRTVQYKTEKERTVTRDKRSKKNGKLKVSMHIQSLTVFIRH